MKYVIVVIVLTVAACREDPYKICDFTEIQQCYDDQAYDSIGLATKLVGKWKWEYYLNCAYAVDGGKDTSVYEGHSIEFLADGTFVLYRPNSTSFFQWELQSIGYDGWAIVDPMQLYYPPHGSLWGRIRVCGDRLLANASYRDGGDNLFVRE